MFEDNRFLVLICIFICIYILYKTLKNPFKYPYFTHSFDVTGKRNINIEDYIDNYLRNEQNWYAIRLHQNTIQEWKIQTEKYIQSCKLRKYRRKQYKNIIDDQRAFSFQFIRQQTRYRQQNYVKSSYKVSVVDSIWETNWQWLNNRHEQLKKIGFEATLRDYNSKNQRKLMTPALRKQIMVRDHYTCQICGKYMPDEVGLHIDHIIPIAKGGKSIPPNLRVLCSKCNGRKGAK